MLFFPLSLWERAGVRVPRARDYFHTATTVKDPCARISALNCFVKQFGVLSNVLGRGQGLLNGLA